MSDSVIEPACGVIKVDVFSFYSSFYCNGDVQHLAQNNLQNPCLTIRIVESQLVKEKEGRTCFPSSTHLKEWRLPILTHDTNFWIVHSGSCVGTAKASFCCIRRVLRVAYALLETWLSTLETAILIRIITEAIDASRAWSQRFFTKRRRCAFQF